MDRVSYETKPHALPWRSGEFSQTVPCRALLYPDEIAYLHWVGTQAVVHGGSIIDLGAFLGGSSLALAQGSINHEGTAPPIHAYDLFRVTESQNAVQNVPGRVGDSFLDQYKGTLHEHMDRITTYEGLIPQWVNDPEQLHDVYPSDGPVAVLFIDCAKKWGVHHTILRVFGPHLKAGSVVIQQDFRSLMVYLAIHMYQLREVLIPKHFPDGGTVGFVAKGPLSQSQLDGLWTHDDVERIGSLSVLKEVGEWFDSLGFDPISPWVWLAGIGEFAQDANPEFIEECIKHAQAGLKSLQSKPTDFERKSLRRELWNGEVRRLASILQLSSFSKKDSLNQIAQRVSNELIWDDKDKKLPIESALPPVDLLWKNIEEQCIELNWSRIALYCSGRHTSDLLASGWPTNPCLQIVAILDDASGKNGYSIRGIPVIHPSNLDDYHPDVVIPSSDVYESAIYPKCQSVAQRVNAKSIRVYSAQG